MAWTEQRLSQGPSAPTGNDSLKLLFKTGDEGCDHRFLSPEQSVSLSQGQSDPGVFIYCYLFVIICVFSHSFTRPFIHSSIPSLTRSFSLSFIFCSLVCLFHVYTYLAKLYQSFAGVLGGVRRPPPPLLEADALR